MSRTVIDGKTLADVYLRRVEMSGERTAHLVKRDGHYQALTWKSLHEKVLGIFENYQSLGIVPGDRVCIISNTRSEWNISDLANLASGVITVPIYQSNTVDDIIYILEHSSPKLIFAEDDAQVAKLIEAFEKSNQKLPVVTFAAKEIMRDGLSLVSFEQFSRFSGNQKVHEDLVKIAGSLTPESMASIVYTSGTTGRPKGVVLTHSNFAAECRSILDVFDLTSDDRVLSFLPNAHILGRVESLMSIFSGWEMAYAESLNSISQNLVETKPTLLISVPRIYEKVFSKIQADVASAPPMKQKIFNWAVKIGRQIARMRSEQFPIPVTLLAKYQIADRLVFSKVRTKMGGRIRMTVSGGAPLAAELCEFFHACGVKILEGYGLTETTAAIAANFPGDYRFGTVGKPLGDSEFKIAPDGEILVRGAMVFKEYYRDPVATKASFTEDGWFLTGDIGEVSDRGFVKITDRKKELIVTSAGKNVAPQKIENLLKSQRFISQVIVCGDKQKFLGALITLNQEDMSNWAKISGISFADFEELIKKETVIKLIADKVKSVNSQLASFETIKNFKLLPKDFTTETGELTPSLKLKRKVILNKYQTYVDELFK
ncbi:MAG: long-chain fatty acid--CoA ligase [Proteobacteria bacterium]|nr:long-chain fatty acid--CoA ligase [Pseudomonadota bacterium]